MGRKAKVGKQRRDKAYWSAKEIGYRSRASFKLVQLNRKFEFLQRSRVCIDLCAAPGSWMQVAREHMPVNSIIVGVDLAPIKPLDGCISFQADITTDKCRSELRKELKDWKADVVLHDGAPNVGQNWIHDAYQQSLLTLASFKLATEFLMKGGTFVTKVFRSKDYQSILWVLNHFFKKVHSTKPAASRNESAEIFVVCLGYKAPDKIDPRFLDAKHVFSELDEQARAGADADEEMPEDKEIVNPEKKRKAAAEGYETGATLLYKKAKASEFILSSKPIHVLNNYNEIVLDEPRIYKHKKTTNEIRECCKDLKVLGMKDLRLLKKWRETLRTEFEEMDQKEKERKEAEQDENGDLEVEDDNASSSDDDGDLQVLDNEIARLKDEERRKAKRLKKKAQKEKSKALERIKLNMVIPGDSGPVMEEEGLFQMKDLKTGTQVNSVTEQEPDLLAQSDSESDDDLQARKKTRRVPKEKGKLDKSGLYYKESDTDEDVSEEGSDSEVDDTLGFDPKDFEKQPKRVRPGRIDKLNDASDNPLLLDLDSSSREARRKKKSEMWFDRDIFKEDNNVDEEALEDADLTAALEKLQPKKGSKQAESSKEQDEDSSDSEEDEASHESSDDELDVAEMKRQKKLKDKAEKKKTKEPEGFEVAPAEPKKKKRKNVVLTPEELTIGQEMIISKKRKRDLMDAGWNRYMFDDRDSNLPDWFIKEEQMHMRPYKELDPKVVAAYRDQQKEMNVKTIKKVVEAKARKKRKVAKRMEKAKKKAEGLLENPDIGAREKAVEIKRMYKKAATSEKKEVAYVVAKKFQAGKRATRPKGLKGHYKQVDPRMKKDTRSKRDNATSKRIQKRRLKGKKTRPERPNKSRR